MGLFTVFSTMQGLVVLNTIATGSLAATSIYEHREQLNNAAAYIADATRSTYRATRNLISSTSSTVANAYRQTKHYIKNKLNRYHEPEYGRYWTYN